MISIYSNDIDLNTLSALETYLADWNGVLLVVSHDRFFTDKVTNHLFVFEGNGAVLDYAGSLTEYAELSYWRMKMLPATKVIVAIV